MDISVIICTYNRSRDLKNVLKSLSKQVVPEGLKWEIVVIDNNSTDDTYKVVKIFTKESDIPIKYVREEKQGLSYARNRGIIESTGKYVVFTDDDAIADKNWIGELYNTFVIDGADCVGGRIYLKCNAPMPKWLTKDLWGFLGFLDYGDDVEIVDVTRKFLFGGNISFRKLIFDKIGFFNTELGRKGKKLYGSEELEFLRRAANHNFKAIYQPRAIVYHVIHESRLNKAYFRSLHYREGILQAQHNETVYNRNLFGVPLFIFQQFFRSILRYIKKPTLRMQMNIWYFLGFMTGRMRRQKSQLIPVKER